jgi:hypothetical protein
MLRELQSVAGGFPQALGALAPNEIKQFIPASALIALCESICDVYESRIGDCLLKV